MVVQTDFIKRKTLKADIKTVHYFLMIALEFCQNWSVILSCYLCKLINTFMLEDTDGDEEEVEDIVEYE